MVGVANIFVVFVVVVFKCVLGHFVLCAKYSMLISQFCYNYNMLKHLVHDEFDLALFNCFVSGSFIAIT